MGMSGGSAPKPDYAAQERAAKAERERLEAEQALEKQREDEKIMAEKRSQAKREAEAKKKRTQLLQAASLSDDSEDEARPSTRLKSLLS